MKRPHGFVGILALSFVASAVPTYAQGVTLRYRWTKGETLTYRVTSQTTSAVTGMPGINEMKIEQGMTQVIKITAEDVTPDGTATLRETFESVKMEMNGPMGRVSYDTAAPSSIANPMIQAMRQVLGAMVGASITVVQAADGTVRKVEGATKILEQMTKTMQEDPAAAAAAQGLKAAFSDEALKTTLEQSFSKLPTDPVKPGDTWPAKLAMGNEMIGRIVGSVVFTLKAIDGAADSGVAQIGVDLTLKQEVAPPPGPNGLVMKLGDARGAGSIVFDLAKGRIQKSTMETNMPSTMTMPAPDGSTATMQNKTTTTMTMELVEKEAR